jgi:hypothetical protein
MFFGEGKGEVGGERREFFHTLGKGVLFKAKW